MPFETAKKAIDYYFSLFEESLELNPNRDASIGFYGGEPLLEFDLIKRCIEYTKQNYSRFEPQFNMTTNGTLLTRERADYLMENKVSIAVSLDGPKEEHDRKRVYANGEGTFDDVMRNVSYLISKGYDKIHALPVYDWKTDILKVNDFFSREDIPQALVVSSVNTGFGCTYYRSFSKESISILPLVKTFSLKEHVSDRFKSTLDDVYGSSIGYTKTSALYGSLNSLIYSLPTILLLIFGGFSVINGVITIGTLTAFVSYTAQFFSPIRTISNLWSQFKSSSASFDRMQELLEMKKDAFGDEELRITEGTVTFDDVRFSYDENRPVLQGVSFECHKGLNYITGDNGCGKSTLLKLLCGFYSPEKGSIRIDGQDIRDIREEDLRKSISILFQDPLLFGTTIYDNIAFGKTSATKEQIVEAAELAKADDFIRKLSQGYETSVGEEGADLSGGEKQKIALARALLKNAPVLLLDEVTKSIDARSKKDIYEALRALKNDKTIIVVTHDTDEMEEGSNVIRIEHGKAVTVISNNVNVKYGESCSLL